MPTCKDCKEYGWPVWMGFGLSEPDELRRVNDNWGWCDRFEKFVEEDEETCEFYEEA